MNRTGASIALPIIAGTMISLPLFLFLPASAVHGDIYTWKDSRGTSHYVNSEYDIPERYRSKARALNLGESQKNGNSSGEQITPAPQGNRSNRVAPILPSKVEKPDANQGRVIRRKFIRSDKGREE